MKDQNSAPVPDAWIATAKAAEGAAPLITEGALPRTVSTLAYIPPERRACYARAMDGSFSLRFIHSDDEHSFRAYESDIAGGKLATFAPGDSPELRRVRERDAQAKVQAILDKVNREEAREREAGRQAALERDLAAVRKQHAQ